MKTIFVTFGNSKTKYCFNTESDVFIGDKLSSNSYGDFFTITDILKESFVYYNSNTGDLSNVLSSTKQGLIKTLKIEDVNNDLIIAKKVN